MSARPALLPGTARRPASRPDRTVGLLSGAEQRDLEQGFRELLPVADTLEPHLRGVLSDVLAAPGGMVRAQLAFALLRAGGCRRARARRLAVAIEYFHTASLLFDDLPAMDDAEERRGRPCPHRIHGEAATMLAGLGLVTRAYALLWSVLAELPVRRRQAASRLVEACLGTEGILDGQARDLHFRGGPRGAAGAGAVLAVAAGKTASLVRLALLLPAWVVGAPAAERRALDALAMSWGLAYQVTDDLRDIACSAAESGKTAQRDNLLGRPNLAAASGAGAALERLDDLLAAAQRHLAGLAAPPAALAVLQCRMVDEAAALRRRLTPRLPARTTAGPLTAGPLTAGLLPRRRSSRGGLHAAEGRLAAAVAADPEAIVAVTVEAPAIAPEAMLAAADDRTLASFWDAPDGAAVGLGGVHRLTASGPGRFASLRDAARRLAGRVVSDPAEPPLRLAAGLGFADDGAPGDAVWRGFATAELVLPRLLYHRVGEAARLTMATTARDLTPRRQRHALLAELEERLERLASAPPRPSTAASAAGALKVERTTPGEWASRVRRASGEIAAGRLEKVVLAERARVTLEHPTDPLDLLARLAATPAGVRFAFFRDDAVFLGISPERLVRRDGELVASEALAGTAASADAEALLASLKDRREHRFVVAALTAGLAPFCRELVTPPRPTLRRHGAVAHLWTPLTGRLDGSHHLLDLAARLHPTPAVGGTPDEAARRFIATSEPAPRGWYAGPVGWLDLAGDGELRVALRCCLLRETTAWLFAGAGIVAGSDAAAEYAEVGLKHRTLLEALAG